MAPTFQEYVREAATTLVTNAGGTVPAGATYNELVILASATIIAGGITPAATSGAVAPASTPTAVGLIYVDTALGDVYISTGTSSSSDWSLLN